MITDLYPFIRQCIDWVLPISCVLCGQITQGPSNICPACTAHLPWIPFACGRCGLPLSQSSAICGACLTSPPLYQHLQALFCYEFPIDQLILGLKFQRHLLYARLLGELLALRLRRYYTTGVPVPAMLIPVPLHKKRLRQRGFNQATELAKQVNKMLHIPIGYDRVQRVKYTPAQMELPLTERAQNVKNAFVVKKSLPAHVAIIDDVVTSGHTIQALSQALHATGVKQIDVWCIARTVK